MGYPKAKGNWYMGAQDSRKNHFPLIYSERYMKSAMELAACDGIKLTNMRFAKLKYSIT